MVKDYMDAFNETADDLTDRLDADMFTACEAATYVSKIGMELANRIKKETMSDTCTDAMLTLVTDIIEQSKSNAEHAFNDAKAAGRPVSGVDMFDTAITQGLLSGVAMVTSFNMRAVELADPGKTAKAYRTPLPPINKDSQ